MAFKAGLRSEMGKIAGGAWAEREGRAVPSESSVSMGNDAKKIDATVLYADLADSTILVDRYKPQFQDHRGQRGAPSLPTTATATATG